MDKMKLEDLRKALDRRELSAVELTAYYLDRIAQHDRELNAFITVLRAEALQMAAAADRRIAAQENVTALTGIPGAIKDNIYTEGIRTTCASRLLANYYPSYDATVVSRLKQAGAVLIGKTNLDEFAMGSATQYSYYGVTRNPWDRNRSAGGSSGGSAVAVAAGMAPLALGSDTGGSIRQPAAFCGVWGLKPTYGRVSRYGVIPYAPSFDQIGPLAASGRDLLLLFQTIAGYDPLDPTSLPDPLNLDGDLSASIRGLRVGLPREFFGTGLDAGIKERVLAAAKVLGAAGCELVELSLPSVAYAAPTYHLLAYAEASASMARYGGVRYGSRAGAGRGNVEMMTTTRHGLGLEVKRRILLGTYFLSADCYEEYYRQAQKVKAWMIRDFAAAYRRCDLLLTPTTAAPAFRFGDEAKEERALALTEQYTVAANLTGNPALSFPCGRINQLPVGAQLIGPAGTEALLIRVATVYAESATEGGFPGETVPETGEQIEG